MVTETVVEQARNKKKVRREVDGYKDKHTESIKANKIAIELRGAGNLSIDRRNGGGRTADDVRTGVYGSEVAGW